jgi:hypothetical protein
MEEVKVEHFLKHETLRHFSNIIRDAFSESYVNLYIHSPIRLHGVIS